MLECKDFYVFVRLATKLKLSLLFSQIPSTSVANVVEAFYKIKSVNLRKISYISNFYFQFISNKIYPKYFQSQPFYFQNISKMAELN